MNNFLKISIVLAAAFASTSVQAQVQGLANDQVVIFYGDIDLASEAGLMQFDRRATEAVNRLCRGSDGGDRFGNYRARSCRKSVTATIRSHRQRLLAQLARTGTIDNDRLALHDQR